MYGLMLSFLMYVTTHHYHNNTIIMCTVKENYCGEGGRAWE